MCILADENVDRPIVEELRNKGFEVKYILEISPGTENGEVLEMAQQEEAILLTADKDFGELVYRGCLEEDLKLKGLVLIRLSNYPLKKRTKIVSEFFEKEYQRIKGKFVVLSGKTVRIRPLRFS